MPVSNETEYQLSLQLQQLILIPMETESRRKGGAKGLALRIIEVEAFIYVSEQIKVRSGIRAAHYYIRIARSF